MGKSVFVAVDCVTSQRDLDKDTAMERMKQAIGLLPCYAFFVFCHAVVV